MRALLLVALLAVPVAAQAPATPDPAVQAELALARRVDQALAAEAETRRLAVLETPEGQAYAAAVAAQQRARSAVEAAFAARGQTLTWRETGPVVVPPE